MAIPSSKTKAFEYVLFKLVEWYNEETNSKGPNDISTLKALKLLFFVSSVNTVKESVNTLLDLPFNNFVAMPYGHVESDIYKDIKENNLEDVIIENNSTIVKNSNFIKELSQETKVKIDNSINSLKSINKKIIELSPFELVELSHKWFSWKINYQKAIKRGDFSHAISISEIKNEDKFYQI
jgi:uncharacterized phage-associated protein